MVNVTVWYSLYATIMPPLYDSFIVSIKCATEATVSVSDPIGSNTYDHSLKRTLIIFLPTIVVYPDRCFKANGYKIRDFNTNEEVEYI